MGWDVGGHAHGDAAGPVHQEVGEPPGQDGGLLHAGVEVVDELYRILVHILKDLLRRPSEAALGVPHGSRWIAIRGTEVALAVQQGIAQTEVLGQPYEGVVHSALTMGMQSTEDLPYDSGALAMRPVGAEAHLRHGVQDAPLDWL